MAGLMSSNTSLVICSSPMRGTLDVETLRRGAFNNEIDADGLRTGWVGLGELLDYDNFFLASCDSRFAGFSWRMDVRKPSPAVIRLQVAEKLREETDRGAKISAKRRREIRESVVDRLTAQAEFVPSLVDCIWDGEKGRLLVCTTSEKLVERVLDDFVATFAAQAQRLEPEVDLGDKFAKILRDDGITAGEWNLQANGTAQLRGEEDAQPKSISVQNSLQAISEALKNDMSITRLGILASRTQAAEQELEFVADGQLGITALKLPKPEKGNDQDASFLINADICSSAVEIMELLGEVTGEKR